MYDIELLYHALNRIAGAIGIRDIIAHHYFDIDEAIVFDVVKNKLPNMLKTIRQMIEEL